MSNPEPGGRPNIVVIGLAAVAVAAAALFFVTRPPGPPPQAPAPVASAPTSLAPANPASPPVATPAAPAPAPAPVAAPEPPPPPPPPPRVVTTIPAFEWPGQVFRVKLNDLSLVNASLSREEIEAILKGGTPASLAEGLSKLNADEFSIRSIEVETEVDGQKSRTIYQNLEGGRIAGGVFSRIAFAEASQAGSVPDAENKPVSYSAKVGQTSIEALDTVTALRWFTESDPTGNAPMKPVHGPYVIAGAEVTVGDFRLEIGRSSAAGFSLRLMRRSMAEMWPGFNALMKKQGTEPDELSAELLADLLEIYGSFEMGRLDIGPVRGTGKAPNGSDIRFAMGAMQLASGSSGGGNLENVDIAIPEANVKLGRFQWEGDFYRLFLVGLAKLALDSDEIARQPEAQVARLRAEIGRHPLPDLGLKLAGLAIDAEQKDKPGERLAFGVDGFEIRNGGFVGVTPSTLAVKLSHFRMPIPPATTDEGLQQLRAIGLETLDLSFNLEGAWDEPTATVTFRDISTSVEQVGTVAMGFTIGNVPRAFFEEPASNWAAVLLTGTARAGSVTVTNRGGVEKAIALAASQTGKKPEQLRLELSTMAPVVMMLSLSDHPDAGAIVEAVGNFLKGLNELSLKARPADGDGLRLLELAEGAEDPETLLKKLRIEANGR